jgi:hypothetical protein
MPVRPVRTIGKKGGVTVTVKQLAQRLGVDSKALDFSFSFICSSCPKTGGPYRETNLCSGTCVPLVKVAVREGRDGAEKGA